MNVHLFGAVSSPSCANFALRKAADDAEEAVGTETADVLRKNFYVDDCLRPEETEESAIQRVRGVRYACVHGGFNLAKFVTNSRPVLESVPDEARAQDVRTLELGSGELPVERALGVQWAIESDIFRFRIILKDQPERNTVYGIFRLRPSGYSSTLSVGRKVHTAGSVSHQVKLG